MKKNKVLKISAIILSLLILIGILPANLFAQGLQDTSAGNGFEADWSGIAFRNGEGKVDIWSILKQGEGYYLNLVSEEFCEETVTFSFPDGSYKLIRFFGESLEGEDSSFVLDDYYSAIPGAYLHSYCDNGVRHSEIFIPEAFFGTDGFAVILGSRVEYYEITDASGTPVAAAYTPEPVMSASAAPAATPSMNMYPGSGSLYSWGVTKVSGGYCFLLVHDQYNAGQLGITNLDGSDAGSGSGIVFNGTPCNAWWAPIDGATVISSEVIDGVKYSEFFVPDSFFSSNGFTVYSGSSAVTSFDIAGGFVPVVPPTQEPDPDIEEDIDLPDEPEEPEQPEVPEVPEQPEEPEQPDIDIPDDTEITLPDTASQLPGNGTIEGWKAIRVDGGYRLVFTGGPDYRDINVSVSYDDPNFNSGSSTAVSRYGYDPGNLHNAWYGNIDGSYTYDYTEDGTNVTEMFIPDSFFANPYFTLTFGSGSIHSSDITDANGNTNEIVITGPIIPGSHYDWNDIPQYETSDGTRWAIVDVEGGYYIYLARTNTTIASFDVLYDDERMNTATQGGLSPWNEIKFLPSYKGVPSLGNNNIIEGHSEVFLENGNMLYTETFIPDDFFVRHAGCTVSCEDVSIHITDIPDANGKKGTTPVPYAAPNMKVDGDISDWDTIYKADLANSESEYYGVDKIAAVWQPDGSIYLYIESYDSNYNAIQHAGAYNDKHQILATTGQMAIQTDLGYEILLRIGDDQNGPFLYGTIEGTEVAYDVHYNEKRPVHYWEIKIPDSALPEYLESITFGPYGGTQPLVIHNPYGVDNSDKFEGIVFDGRWEDWDYYPHQLIEYATFNTHTDNTADPDVVNVVDGEGAILTQDGYVLGHTSTCMPSHIEQNAWEVGKFNIVLNLPNRNYTFNPDEDFQSRLVAVDPDGNVIYDVDSTVVPENGNNINVPYHYYLLDISYDISPADAPKIDDLIATGKVFGEAYITRTPSTWEIEYKVDIEKLAEKKGIDPDDIQTVNAQFIRIGDDWITCAGTSTGAIWGLLLCFGVVAASYIKKKAVR